MKRLLLFALLALPFAVNAQSFDRSATVFELRGELAAYKTTSKDKVSGSTSDGGAASKLINLSFEHGIFEIIGVGLKFQFDNYFTDADTIYHTAPTPDEYVIPSVTSFDIAPVANFHLARGEHFDLPIGFTFGVSFLNYNLNDAQASRAHGTGTWFDAHITPRFYFGDHFGLNINLSYARFNYPNVIAENSSVQAINAFALKGGGMTFGIGFQYRL